MVTDPLSQSLNEIHGWPDRTGEGDYPLVRRVLAACRKPVCELDADEIRLLIGQDMGIEDLMPLALDILENDPFAEATSDNYALLRMCLKVDAAYWREQPAHRPRLEEIAMRVVREPRDDWQAYMHEDLIRESKDFLNSYPP